MVSVLKTEGGLIASRGFESHPNRHFRRGAGIGKQASLETKRVNSPRTVGTCPLRHWGISETASHFTVYEVAPDRPRYAPPSCKTVSAVP